MVPTAVQREGAPRSCHRAAVSPPPRIGHFGFFRLGWRGDGYDPPGRHSSII